MAKNDKTLADPDEMLDFVTTVLGSLGEAVRKMSGFSPIAFIVATQDPNTKKPYKTPRAIPLSLDLIEQSFGSAVLEGVDRDAFFDGFVKKTASMAKAIGVVVASYGTTVEEKLDENMKPTGKEQSREVVLVTMEHIRVPSRAWLAEVVTRGFDIIDLKSFQELHSPDGKGFSRNILPSWN